MASARLSLSVVVPTHDRRDRLLGLLAALRDGTLPHESFEVVIVADGCTDGTAAAVRATPFPFPVLVLEQSPSRGAAAARNLGGARSKGELLVFLDDDIVPLPALLESHVRAHERSSGDAIVVGPPLAERPERSDFHDLALWGWWEEFLARLRRPGHRFAYDDVLAGNLSVPSALFAALGGFDESFLCREDYELGVRVIASGASIVFAPDAAGYHRGPRDRNSLIARKRAEGRADIQMARRHPWLGPALPVTRQLATHRSMLGVLRRLAFAAPGIGDRTARLMTRMLDGFEYLRMRGSWRSLQAGVMYYWYWRGVADACGSPLALAELAARCDSAAAAEANAVASAELELDLRDGIPAAERRLDVERPASVRMRFFGDDIGRIPPRPGAERLRGVHLRPYLATELAWAFGRTLQREEARDGRGARLSATQAAAMASIEAPGAALQPDTGGAQGLTGLERAASIAHSGEIGVSVIIAAYNAADTVPEALDSLLGQTFSGWQAIVVDDGSTDETATVAARYAARDERIEVIRQKNLGEGCARNAGLRRARHEWVLFFDADDQLLPGALEQLTSVLSADASLDAVHGGWARVTPGGAVMDPERCVHTGNLFHLFAEYCAFPIHACVVRRSVVDNAGGFDSSLRTCEDWDLWQRIARAGARFGNVNDVVAHYRMREGSLSTGWSQLFADGFRVITTGHARDPRVPDPEAACRDGAPAQELADAQFRYTCWVAGLVIGRGEDARSLLDTLRHERAPGLDPQAVAYNLFRTAPLALARPPWAWDELWPRVGDKVDGFLQALEEQSGAWRVARRARRALESLTVSVSLVPRPFTRNGIHALRVDTTAPIPNITVARGVEHVHCAVEVEGELVGTLLLPVCDGVVPAGILADAIVAEHAWAILGRFFWRSIYPGCEMHREADGWSAWLAGVRVAMRLPDDEAGRRAALHDQMGWSVFLRELWGATGRPESNRPLSNGASVAPADGSGWAELEVSGEAADIPTTSAEINVLVRVGGVTVGVVSAMSDGGIVSAASLREIITDEFGLELCKVAVREGILGAPLESGAGTLRERLAASAATTAASRGGPPPIRQSTLVPPEPSHHSAASDTTATHTQRLVAPDWTRAIANAAPNGERVMVLARHEAGAVGTSASRRASLPVAAEADVLDAAVAAGQPVVQLNGTQEQPQRLIYAPDLLWLSHQRTRPAVPGPGANDASRKDPSPYGRHHFEALFATRANPWRYETAYEQLKYEQTLALLPPERPSRALELACAEGHFTRALAARVDTLVAADISQVALERAAVRCADCRNVRFQRLDLTSDQLPGPFDLIVCSEVLYYAGDREALARAARKLAEALAPGGRLLLAHANLVVDDPHHTGFDWAMPFGGKVIGETLARVQPLHLVKEVQTELYRVQVFQRERLRSLFPGPVWLPGPPRVEIAPYAPPEPNVARHIVWGGGVGQSVGTGPTTSTSRLPILMYHRVASEGAEAGARYRVTPDAFEEQLRYLRDGGFHSVTLDEWCAAVHARRPLPGRSVLLTFDDGFRDFATHAWPLLRRYGFLATVFLVADLIGRTNEWDASLDEVIPLLGWEEIRRLQEEGVDFGSHSATHHPMTGLSHEDVVSEAARSRAILRRGLGRPVIAFAYPHGDTDRAVQHFVGASGYSVGLSTRSASSGFADPLLALPRIEVSGFDSLPDFIAKLVG